MIHALQWIASHPAQVLTALIAFCSVVTALTPTAHRKDRWYSALVRLADRLSTLTHPDSPGTLKWPGIASSLVPEVGAVLSMVRQEAPPPNSGAR